MRKKIVVLILILICSVALAVGIAACAGSEIDDLIAQGYTIWITYDANGGNFGEPGLTYRYDFYNPDTIEPEEDGYIHIQLQDFADRTGLTGTANRDNATRDSYGFWGWYQTKDVYLDENGDMLDYGGNVLRTEEDDSGDTVYYYVDSEGKKVESEPIYMYSDEWDFETSEIIYDPSEYAEGELFEMTLYAAWIPNFVFNYYYYDEKEGYVLYGSTSFDYATQHQNGTLANCIWSPEFPDEGGGMLYIYDYESMTHVSRSSGSTYSFPKLSGYTFNSAYYYDADGKLEEMVSSVAVAHTGYVTDSAVAVNYVMDIFVVFDEGERYHIKTAEQFRDCATATSYLIIYNDIDFGYDSESGEEGVNWPSTLDIGTFTGKIWTCDGSVMTLSNIYVKHQTESATLGGLFGCIGAKAEISDIAFENVTYDLYTMGRAVSGAYIGLFAGDIENGATLIDVSLSGDLEFKIGAVSAASSGNWINVLSNADLESFGVTLTDINSIIVSCYSSTTWTEIDGRTTYRYNIAVQGFYPSSTGENNLAVSVDEALDITFGRYSSSQNYYYTDKDQTDMQYYFEAEYIVFRYPASSDEEQNT